MNTFATKLTLTPLAVTLAVCLLHSSARAADDTGQTIIHEAFPEFVPIDPNAQKPEPMIPMSDAIPGAFLAGVNIFDLGPVTPERIAEADLASERRRGDVRPGPLRIGIVRRIEPAPLTGGDALSLAGAGGYQIWTLAVQSPDAFGIRLHFTHVDLGADSMVVYAYGKCGVVSRGPFTERGPRRNGDFWTASLPGDMAYIEVRSAEQPRFDITEIVHFDRDPAGAGAMTEDGGTNGPGVFDCHINSMCLGDPPLQDRVRRATGQMNYMSGGEDYVCTGTLITDDDPDTRVPHFITAAHCLNTQSEVNTLEVVWFWNTVSCEDETLPDHDLLERTLGGTLLATSGENDMTFIRLAGDLPSGIGLAGWTTETGLDPAVGVHHPSGSWQRATLLSGVGVCPGCVCVDPTDFDYYDMDDGLVEGGSSGSGVFNYSGQLAGQLKGRCSDFSDPDDMDCGNIDSYWAVYGEFEETYPLINYWLRIGGTMHVNPAAAIPPWDGSAAHPFILVSQANNAAWDGLRIKIAPGSYAETMTITKQLTLISSGGVVTIGE